MENQVSDHLNSFFSLQDAAPALNGKPLSASTGAWLLCYVPVEKWVHPEEIDMLVCGIEQACNSPLSCAVLPQNPRGETREELLSVFRKPVETVESADTAHHRLKIFTDYSIAQELMAENDDYEVVSSEGEADFIFALSNITDFYAYPLRTKLNQFPYEGGLVRKDLLPLTVRRYCYKQGQAPKWWLPCYDLTTEFHYFADEILRRSMDPNALNTWILKPARGTHAFGHYILKDRRPVATAEPAIELEGAPHTLTPHSTFKAHFLTNSTARAMLHEASQIVALLPTASLPPVAETYALPATNLSAQVRFSKDRVGQLLVRNPLLVKGLKFDVRVIVLVRSFVPFEGSWVK